MGRVETACCCSLLGSTILWRVSSLICTVRERSATFSDVCFRSNRARVYVRPHLWHLVYCQSQYMAISTSFKRSHSRPWTIKKREKTDRRNFMWLTDHQAWLHQADLEVLAVFSENAPTENYSHSLLFWHSNLLLSVKADSLQSAHLTEIGDEMIGVTKSKSIC